MSTLRPWIDGYIPAQSTPSRLLAVGRADVEVLFLERVGSGSGRVLFPVDSANEVVAPLAEGVYSARAICPATLGADGRIAIVYPPLDLPEDEGEWEPVGDYAEAQYAQSLVVESHGQRLDETEQLVAETKDDLDALGPVIEDIEGNLAELPGIQDQAQQAQQDAMDALEASNLARAFAEGLLTIGVDAPEHEDGRVWLATDEDGNLTGIYQSVDDAWATYTVITGVLIVPGGDGMATVIDQNGMIIGSIAAESITGEVIAAETIGAKHLVLADIGSEYFTGDVNADLEAANAWSKLTLLEPGKITISQAPIGAANKLTALILQPTKLDFVVEDESRAYIDSERNLMSIENVYVRDTAQIGQHQVKTLPGTNITIFNWTGE